MVFHKIDHKWLKHQLHPHLTMTEPQVRPAPNPAAAIVWPGCTFPLRTASSNANGMDAALVLPKFAKLDITRSDGTSKRVATASIILWFACNLANPIFYLSQYSYKYDSFRGLTAKYIQLLVEQSVID